MEPRPTSEQSMGQIEFWAVSAISLIFTESFSYKVKNLIWNLSKVLDALVSKEASLLLRSFQGQSYTPNSTGGGG